MTRLVPFADLNLRARVADDGALLGLIDNNGNPVYLPVLNAAGQLVKSDGTDTAFRSDTLPVNSVAPAITGDTADEIAVDGEITCGTGTWSGADNVYTYQWMLDGVAIVGATAAAYTALLAQVGSELTCVVTATNPAGSDSESSIAITVIA